MARRKSNGEGSISIKIRNGKNYYTGAITLGWDSHGKQIRKTFSSFKKSDVVDKMNTAKYEYKRGLKSSNEMTFGELFHHWIFNYKKQEVSNNTFYEYETVYRLRIEPYKISRLKSSEITLDDLQRYFNKLQEKFSANTIKKTYIQINSCMAFAVIQGIILRNLCPGVSLQKLEKKEKLNVFSKEEQKKIIEFLDLRDIIDCLIYFTFYTGLRLGESLGVKWEDINDKNVLKVARQYRRKVEVTKVGERTLSYEFKKLKTKNSEREIPLPQKAIDLLNNMIRTGDLIFSDCGKPIEPKRPQRKITKICKDLNIPHRSFHALRHSYATRLFELNIPVKAVQTLLGHSEIGTTMDIYTHVMLDKKVEYIDQLNQI